MWYHLLLISWVLISVNQCTHAQNQSCDADNGTCTKSGSSSSRNKNNSKSQPKTNYSESTFPDKRSKAGGPSNSNDNSNTASKREDVGDSDGFDIYQSKIEFARKLKEGRKAVDQALRSTSNERCDWRVSPLKYLKGEWHKRNTDKSKRGSLRVWVCWSICHENIWVQIWSVINSLSLALLYCVYLSLRASVLLRWILWETLQAIWSQSPPQWRLLPQRDQKTISKVKLVAAPR